MFHQQLIDCANELVPRVNLEELWPLQRSSPVNAGQCFGHLFGLFCSQRLSRFESAGDIDHGEGILICFASDLIMRQKEEVSLVDLVRRGDVECAVEQGGRSARWPASSAIPRPHFQRTLLWLRDFVLP